MSHRSSLRSLLALACLTGCAEMTRPTARPADLDIVVPAAHRLSVLNGPQRDCVGLLYTDSSCPPPTSGEQPTSGTQTPPAGLPTGYEWNSFLNVKADAGFTGQGAYGQSVVNFTATNATADVKLTLSSGGSSIGSNAGHEETSSIFPVTGGITAQTTIAAQETCGLTASAHADGSAWDSFLLNYNLVSWGKKSSSDDKTTPQSACAPTGVDGGGTGVTYCYYYYEYSPVTGQIFYVVNLGCFTE